MKQANDLFLNQITEILLQKTPAIGNLGLFNGKAGIALFFYRFSFYENNETYKKFAEVLIDDVCEELASIPNLGFSDGLAGIGWSFAYLMRNNFLDATTDEGLSDIDEIILKKQSLQATFYNHSGDVFGAGIYCLSRLYTPEINTNSYHLSSKTHNVLFLIDECENIISNHLSKNPDTPALRPQTLISIAYFLIEAYKLGLNVKKTKALLSCMPIYFEVSSRLYIDNEEKSFFLTLLENIALIIDDKNVRSKCALLIKELSSNRYCSNVTIENLTTDCSRKALYSLVYQRQLSGKNKDAYKAQVDKLINDDILTTAILNQPYTYNLGLNGGLAGIGLAILESVKE